jgi:hypothetical protein
MLLAPLLATAWGLPPAAWDRAKFGRLIPGSALDGDTV